LRAALAKRLAGLTETDPGRPNAAILGC